MAFWTPPFKILAETLCYSFLNCHLWLWKPQLCDCTVIWKYTSLNLILFIFAHQPQICPMLLLVCHIKLVPVYEVCVRDNAGICLAVYKTPANICINIIQLCRQSGQFFGQYRIKKSVISCLHHDLTSEECAEMCSLAVIS